MKQLSALSVKDCWRVPLGALRRMLAAFIQAVFPRHLSIKYHIVGHFSFALALIFILSGMTIYSFVHEYMRSQLLEKLSIATDSVSDIVENAANISIRNHLQTVAKVNIDILNGLEHQVRQGELTRVAAQKKGAEILLRQQISGEGYVYVLSSQGVMLVHPDTRLVNQDLSGFSFIQQQMKLKNGSLEYEWTSPGGHEKRPKALYMAYFEPWDWIVSVSSYVQEFDFPADDLRLDLHMHHLGKTGYAFVVNGHGDIIAHPSRKGNVNDSGNVALKQVVERMSAMKNGDFSYSSIEPGSTKSKTRLVSFNSLPNLDWIVAVIEDEDAVFQPLARLGKIMALITCCAFLLILPVSFYLGALVTGPLFRLTQQMRIAAEGNLSVRADVNAPGEIGVLGHYFNQYVETLRSTNSKALAETHDRGRAERQLLIYHKAFEYALEGISITDAQGNILAVNQAFSELTGYSAAEAIGQNPSILKSEKHDSAFYQKMWKTLHETGRWSGEIWNRRKNGEVYPEFLRIRSIYDEAGEVSHYVAVFHDITDLKQQEEQIVHQAYHDALTGLPNRTLAHDRIGVSISHAKRHGSKLAILFLDLDNFKNVNDSLGHEIGDKLLLQVANRLVSLVRDEDTVARLGGDEFLILMADFASKDAIQDMVQRILKSVAAPFIIGDSELFVSASIGVALYPSDGDTSSALIQNADIAMYQAKTQGKNNYCLYTSDLSDRISYLRQLETNLRQAIVNKEFTIYLQPKIDPLRERVIGAEALVRWQKESGSVISPADFIPLAEETGLIIPLGEQVLDISCRVLHELNIRGFSDISVSVNLSPLQFVQNNLVDKILATLNKYALPGDQLELEITETTMMTNLTRIVETLDQLVSAGISISIDDFGTGYSSLAYLKKFPIKTLKIDRSFIRDLTTDPNDAQIVETIIYMAHNLGIEVVAEGVESREQLEWLKKRSCELVQGYYYSKPLPLTEFFSYLHAMNAPGEGEGQA